MCILAEGADLIERRPRSWIVQDKRAAAESKLDVLRDAFDRNAGVHIEFIRTGCQPAAT